MRLSLSCGRIWKCSEVKVLFYRVMRLRLEGNSVIWLIIFFCEIMQVLLLHCRIGLVAFGSGFAHAVAGVLDECNAEFLCRICKCNAEFFSAEFC